MENLTLQSFTGKTYIYDTTLLSKNSITYSFECNSYRKYSVELNNLGEHFGIKFLCGGSDDPMYINRAVIDNGINKLEFEVYYKYCELVIFPLYDCVLFKDLKIEIIDKHDPPYIPPRKRYNERWKRVPYKLIRYE